MVRVINLRKGTQLKCDDEHYELPTMICGPCAEVNVERENAGFKGFVKSLILNPAYLQAMEAEEEKEHKAGEDGGKKGKRGRHKFKFPKLCELTRDAFEEEVTIQEVAVQRARRQAARQDQKKEVLVEPGEGTSQGSESSDLLAVTKAMAAHLLS